MKRIVRNITAASGEDVNEQLEAQISTLKEDFDYILDGLDRLGRTGANSSNDAKAIAETIQNSLNNYIQEIADKVGSEQ